MEQKQKVKISELKRGDILLLSPDMKDMESRLIALISKSPVSHAAMSYDVKGNVIEQSPPSVMIDTIMDRKDRETYVMRLNTDLANVEPVMDIAQKYYEEKLPYADNALPCIALYLLMKDIKGSSKFLSLMTRLMKVEMELIIDFLNHRAHLEEAPMVCSQFVYHCYKEAGPKYEIILKDENESSLLKSVVTYIKENDSKWNEKLLSEEPLVTQAAKESIIHKDEIINEIYDELQKEQGLEQVRLFNDDFMITTYQYCKALAQMFNLKNEVNSNNENKQTALDIMEKLREMQEYFITPGDLLKNTENLIYLGILDFEE